MSDHSIRLILRGWHQVTSGPALGGDRFWNPKLGAWIPVVANCNHRVSDFAAVIRKGDE